MTPHELNYRLLKTLSRVTFKDADIDEADQLLRSSDLDKASFLSACFKQKVAGLVAYNLARWELEGRLLPWLRLPLKLFYLSNKVRNEKILNVASDITLAAAKDNIDIRPLKGTVLLPYIYSDGGSRILFDTDFFVRRRDLSRLSGIMEKFQFCQGRFERGMSQIEPLSREDKILWAIKMFETPPFLKLSDDPYLQRIFVVDFSFGLGFEDREDTSEKILQYEGEIGGWKTITDVDFFIQLCCHLYKEASNESWIKIDQDINLIKFCDIREFAIKTYTPSWAASLRSRIAELSVEKQVYFSLYMTYEIYEDSFIPDLISQLMLTFNDLEFMDDVYRQGVSPVRKRTHSLKDAIGKP